MMKRLTKIIIAMLLVLLPVVPNNVYAANNTLTIKLKDLGTNRENVKFKLYKVGDTEIDSVYDVVYDNLNTASDFDEAANKIANYISLHNVTFNDENQSDINGELSFPVDNRIYLLVASSSSNYGNISPVLIKMPYIEEGVQKTKVTIYPKAEIIVTPEPDDTLTGNEPTDTPSDNDQTDEPNNDQSSDKDDDSSTNKSNDKSDTKPTIEDKLTNIIKSGDNSNIMKYIILLLVPAIIMILIFKKGGINHD